MGFCVNCGTKLGNGIKFCPECGTAVAMVAKSESDNVVPFADERLDATLEKVSGSVFGAEALKTKAELVIDDDTETKFSPVADQNESDELTESFNGSVREFEKLLLETSNGDYISYLSKGLWSAWGPFKKFGYVLLWVLFFPIMAIVHLATSYKFNKSKLQPNEFRRANIVENYVFANDNQTALEALYFIKGQLDQLENVSRNSYMAFWVNLWKKKATSIFEKSFSISEDPAIQGIYDEIDVQASALLDLHKKRYGAKFVILVLLLLGIGTFNVVVPKLALNSLNRYTRSYQVSDDSLTDSQAKTWLKSINKENTIAAENVQFYGIMEECFESGGDVKLTLLPDEELIQVDMTVVCKQDFGEMVTNELAEKNIDAGMMDYEWGEFYLNGNNVAYIGTYGADRVAGATAYQKLLKAKPGDVITFKLYADVITSYSFGLEDAENLMKSENLLMGINTTYYNGEDNYEDYYQID
ncbi:MAG: zinc ribbon domain-containing protein [Butyrivibrio sp.]|nr:zinc ribbon domain-containing protein [Butyrivibrio sp.]